MMNKQMITQDVLSCKNTPKLNSANVNEWTVVAGESVEQPGGFAWSFDGAAWSAYRDVILIAHGRRHILSGHHDYIAGITFSSEGRRLASASHDTTIRVWDVLSCREQATLIADPYMSRGVSFNADGTYLASCGGDRLPVRLWNVIDGKEIRQFDAPETDSFQSVVFTPKGDCLAACDLTGQVVLWDSESGGVIAIGHHKDMTMAVAISPDGLTLASVSQDGCVKLWNVPSLTLQTEFKVDEGVFSVAFHPKENMLIAGDMIGRLHVWNLKTNRLIRTISVHTDLISSIALDPSGTLLASVSMDGSIKILGSSL
ncbi:MAG: hypothetical protein CVU41_16855 [Chloroflexi bacterium HGW-Chloroflexi-3]|nr:MAG: hypothetical protein CVU41_16855 [Chloroflexi bacterium HGW-Chloroflexi-3]